MQSNLYIPTKIRVGFQKRQDTFTGKLAYVICFDEKGNLRKESSWNSWRDKSIEYIDLDNKPTGGFVLNKGIQRNGHFGSGRSVVRVHHPDEFEFEISMDNLVGILMNTDVSKRDIQSECVFSWSGKDLVLLPTNSMEYQSAIEFTEKQSKSISSKDLKKGHTYIQKKSDQELIYLGYFNFFDNYVSISNYKINNFKKRHVFYTKDLNFYVPAVSTLAECTTDVVDNNYSNAYDKFEKSKHYKEMTKIIIKDPTLKENDTFYTNRNFKNFGSEKIMFVQIDNFLRNNEIYFDSKNNRLIGIDFGFLLQTDEGYKQEQYFSHNWRTTHKLKEFFEEFPELVDNKFTAEEFLELLKIKDFKNIYISTDVKDSEQFRL